MPTARNLSLVYKISLFIQPELIDLENFKNLCVRVLKVAETKDSDSQSSPIPMWAFPSRDDCTHHFSNINILTSCHEHPSIFVERF